MKITIEVEVPNRTVEYIQAWTHKENEYSGHYAVDPKTIDGVEVFTTLYMSGAVDYTVTKAEMHESEHES